MASAAWLAEARSLLDWHMRNRHCAYCGAPTTHVEGGWRRSCPNAPDATTNPKGTCLAGVQNYAHPRTDPVAMACAVHPLGNALLLGRSPGWPTGMYSCTAGFIEPGETIEAAARREVAEETGVDVGAVEYIASQPWPMPNSLMIGCMAQATSEDIVLRDHELEHAAWFTTAQVADMVAKSDTMFNSGQTHTVRSDPTAAVAVTGANFIPGRMSIAGLLIREWLYQWSEMAADLIPPTPPGGRRAHM
ncbi:NUDIX hydrolase domain-like protein [Blastocladiella britannica]|nr:NUDIX hydrolase domain-like protein [Blastocladiella britannica]